jgi:two-component system, sensor histidine kinase YesM
VNYKRVKKLALGLPKVSKLEGCVMKSIQTKLIVAFLIASFIPLILLGIVTYSASSFIIRKNVTRSTMEIMDQVDNNINYYLEEMEVVSADIINNSKLIEIIKNYKGTNDYEVLSTSKEVKKMLIDHIGARNNIKAISILTNDNVSFSSTYNIISNFPMRQWWYSATLEKNGASLFTSIDPNTYGIDTFTTISKKDPVITLIKQINEIYTNKPVAILTIDIYYSVIEETLRKLHPNADGMAFLFDSYGNMLYASSEDNNNLVDKKALYSDIISLSNGADYKNINHQKYMRIYRTSSLSNWKLVEIIPYDELMAPANYIRSLTLILVSISLMLTFIIYFYIFNKVIKPIKQLSNLMNAVESGNLDVNISISGNDEIGKLSFNFNNMIAKLKEMKENIYSEQELKRQAEFSALQAQIHPHFLYNTLDSIKWMAIVQGNNNISSMITALVTLLKNSINKGGELITIQQELDNISNFIKIHSLRYYNSFDITYDIPDDVRKLGILKLLLQPLVENALFHGIESMEVGGVIHISVVKEQDRLLCNVIDNGNGMSEYEINEIFNNSKTKFNGIGIKNVDERIKLNFGTRFGLVLESEKYKYTKATIILPIINMEEGESDAKSFTYR